MHFNNPIPRAKQPYFREASRLRSLRDKSSTGHLWKSVGRVSAQDSANLNAIQLLQGQVSKLKRRIVGGAPQATTGGATAYAEITALHGDYIECDMDGTTVNVAKQPEQRTSLTTETIDAATMTYTYSDSNNRSASDGANSQLEVLYPRYATGAHIFIAQSTNGTGVTSCDWVDITARVWARKYNAA